MDIASGPTHSYELGWRCSDTLRMELTASSTQHLRIHHGRLERARPATTADYVCTLGCRWRSLNANAAQRKTEGHDSCIRWLQRA